MLDIPVWINELADARTIDVLVCRDFNEATIVRRWVEEQVPGIICSILSVPLAHAYLVVGLAQVEQGGETRGTNDPQGK